MLVIDEAFDMWAQGKSAFDYSLTFAEWWERDIEAMIVKDRNYPSVIMYSIGNEIPETGDPTVRRSAAG
jgi:beta-galactosidase